MSPKEILDNYLDNRDFSGSAEDSYAQDLMTMFVHLSANNEKEEFFELLEMAHNAGKKLSVVYPEDIFIDQINLDMITILD